MNYLGKSYTLVRQFNSWNKPPIRPAVTDAAVVFDDAHVAEHLLRDQFSLQIDRGKMPATYSALTALFRDYHHEVGRGTSYDAVTAGQQHEIFWAPPFAVASVRAELARLLLAANLQDDTDTMFSWQHLQDHTDLCCVLISADAVTLTPPFVPVSTLPYFAAGVRRVYLSATLGSLDVFARTFGRTPKKVIAPSTTAGECERLVLIPSKADSVDDDVASTATVLAEHKALVLVPTHSRAQKWKPAALVPEREKVSEAVRTFRAATASQKDKLVLVGRYDGVDLPGDTCRMMIIDDLPRGSGPLEHFQWHNLKLSSSLRSTIASRIIQSFGRISRGMSDHGVVMITGRELVRWLEVPVNKAMLPEFLRRQIKIGYDISKDLKSDEEIRIVARTCIERDAGWINKYKEWMKTQTRKGSWTTSEKLVDVALAETSFIDAFWDRDFGRAAQVLSGCLESTYEVSDYTGAWHSVWLGYALDRAGDTESACAQYKRARAVQKNIPRVPGAVRETATDVPPQILRIEEQFEISTNQVRPPKGLHSRLAYLNGSGSSSQVEDALRHLGQHLGLESTRPEKEAGTGPDVLWVTDDHVAVCIEAKTGKSDKTEYTKHNIGQLSDHVQWVKDNTDVRKIVPMFVGPRLPVSRSANPGHDVLVVELSEFEALGKRLVAALADVASEALPLTLRPILHERLTSVGLLWPDFQGTLNATTLRDTRQETRGPERGAPV